MKLRFVVGGLLAVAALIGGWLLSLDFEERLATQVTELLPADERDPGVRMVRSLATTEHARTVLILIEGGSSPQERRRMAAAAREVLDQSPLVAEVWLLDSPTIPERTLEQWTRSAVEWFWPQWWEAQGRPRDAGEIAASAVERLTRFLERPDSSFWEDAVTSDPFLLVPSSLERLGDAFPMGTSANPAPDQANARLWVRLAVSPFSPEGQQPVFDLLQEAEEAAAAVVPDAQLRDAGVHRLASASETAIRGEITRLNVLVAATVTVLCLLFLRRWSILGPLLLIMAVTLTGGALATLLLFDRVHVLTMVIGSILIGVAVDYGLHVFLEADAKSPKERLRKVTRPLLVGSLSTIGGFLVLTATDLPILRQMGVFIAGGLAFALFSSLLMAASAPRIERPVRTLERLRLPGSQMSVVILFLVLSPLLVGLFRIEWSDNIRELDYPLPGLQAEDVAIRERFRESGGRGFVILGGDWATVVRDARHLEATGVRSLASWVSPPELARAAWEVARSADVAEALRVELAANEFMPEAFAPFFEQWSRWTEAPWTEERYEVGVAAQLQSLPGPAALLTGSGAGMHWMSVRSPGPIEPPAGVQLVALEQLESLNAVFGRYRQEALQVAVFGLAILAVGLLAGFGLRLGAAIVLLPILPVLLVLGALGWRGHALNLFHLLGAFLSICLTVDYVVFALQARRWRHPLPVSITLAALTTGGSFLWLATSAIPAVAALGMVVAPSVFLAWVLALGLTADSSPPQMSGQSGTAR